MVVEFRTRKSEMRGYGENHHETLGLKRILCASQLTIPDTAGTNANPACNYNDGRSSQPNQASCTPGFSYPLVSSISFSSLSPIFLFLVHNSTIIAEHKVKSSLSVSPCHDHELTPSTAFTEYSIHRIQHTPKIVGLPFILIIKCWPLNVASASGVPPYMIDHHQRPLNANSNVKSHSHRCELTNWWNDSQHPALRPLTASKYSSKLTRLWPPSSHDHGIQVHISKLARSQPPSVSPNWLDYGLQLCTIMASKCIYTLAWSWPPSASPNSLDHSLQVYL